jgi:hypothetical protein
VDPKFREEIFQPEKGLYDVTLERNQMVRRMAIHLCDLDDQPIFCIKAINGVNNIRELYPYALEWDRTIRIEKIVFEESQPPQTGLPAKAIGKCDRIAFNEYFNTSDDSGKLRFSRKLQPAVARCGSVFRVGTAVYKVHDRVWQAVLGPAHEPQQVGASAQAHPRELHGQEGLPRSPQRLEHQNTLGSRHW